MKKGIWLILLILPMILFSQEPSSKPTTEVQINPNKDSIQTLWILSDSLSTIDSKKALVYLNMALQMALKSGNEEDQVLTLNRLSALHLQRGELDEALDSGEKALQIYHKKPGLMGYIDALHNNEQVYERRIKNLEKDNVVVRKRNIGIIAVLLLFITFLFISMYQIKSMANMKLVKANNEIHAKNEEISKAYQILDLVARKDPLTNLSNRRDIEEKLQYAQYIFERNQKPFSIIMADIDFFKEINDSFGHDAGDYVLVFLSKLIQKTIRKQDIVSRWGGDEFLLLLPETDMNGGMIVAEKIRTQMSHKSCIFGNKLISFTISAGVCSYTENGDIDVCIKKADEALYESKRNGRDQVTAGNEC